MNTFKFKGGARLAATAGLGLTLALGVAPTVAMAEEVATEQAAELPGDMATATADENVSSGAEESVLAASNSQELLNAIQNAAAGQTVKLTGDVQLSSRLAITKGITLDLGGNTLSAADGFSGDGNTARQLVGVDGANGVTIRNGTIKTGATNRHALNVWNAQNVTLSGLKLDHSSAQDGAPLVVGASGVTVEGKLEVVTGKNSWYGINVDSRVVSGSNVGASLEFSDGSAVAFSGPKGTGVYVENSQNMKDDKSVEVTFAEGARVTGPQGLKVVEVASGATAGVTVDVDGSGLVDCADGGYGVPVATADHQPYLGLQAAIDAAASAADKTVKLENDVALDGKLTLSKSIKIDGNNHTLALAEGKSVDTGALIEVTANNVTISKLTVKAANAKHGIQFYCVKGGLLEGVTVNGGYWTSVLVNGSEVEMNGCKLAPKSIPGKYPAYAAIDFSMGQNVTEVPKLKLSAVSSNNTGVPLVWVDANSLDRIGEKTPNLGTNPTAEAIVSYINNQLLEGATIYLKGDTASTVKPEEPSKPSNPGGGSSTVTKHKVTVADAEGGEVKVTPTSAKKGDTVTIAATPDDGMKVNTVTVKDASGKAIEVEAGKDAGTWTFKMPGSAVTVTVAFADAWENPFADVSEDDWFYGAVREAHKLGLMKGIEGTDLFSPLSGAFREQAATVMWNWLGEGDLKAPAAPFTDVLQGEWYAPYVNWANEAGVMTGYDGTGAFGVGESLTREQFASMVARAAGADLDAVDTSVLDSFGDADGVSPWAETAMAWAVDAGVISGVETEEGSRELQAARGITRAEMAQMIVNTVKSGVVA